MTGTPGLLVSLVGHLALTALPLVAAVLFAVRRGVRDVPIILAIALAVSGVSGFVAFGAYYADPTIGIVWDYLLVLGSIEVAVLSLRGGRLDRELLSALATPLLLWVIGTAFVIFFGFLHGGIDQGTSLSAVRFTYQLPGDNEIPRFFTQWFAAQGHVGTPPLFPGDWMMSDRPPLQVGYALSQHAFTDTTGLIHYEVLSVALQQLWIIGMWAVLSAARVSNRARALAMAAAMISDVAIVHAFFVWPKLLAAAFLLAALAVVVSPRWREFRRDPRVSALFATLLALAMLAHGSSLFGVIGLVAIVALRSAPSWRWLGIAVVIGGAVYLPWVAYQHYADPPGNRLVKWQLGGSLDINSDGSLETIVNSYRAAGVSGTLENKQNNLEEITGYYQATHEFVPMLERLEGGHLESALGPLRQMRFFSLFAFLGVFLLGPLLMLAGRRRRRNEGDWRFALLGLGFAAVSVVAWGLLLFGGPDSVTSIHVGSMAVPLVAVVACVVGLHSVYPRLATALVAFNILFVLVVYTPSLQPPPGTSYSPLMAVLALASLAALALVLFGPLPLLVRRLRDVGQELSTQRSSG
jgi:hypothetical protein